MKSRTVKRVSSRSPCASGIGVAAASLREIGRLQVPVQRLLEPEDAVRLDPPRELDAVGQIVRRVHVEHQIGDSPIAARTAPTRSASSAGVPAPVFSLTAR